MAELWLAPRYY